MRLGDGRSGSSADKSHLLPSLALGMRVDRAERLAQVTESLQMLLSISCRV